MKRKLLLITIFLSILVLSGCNRQVIDTTYSYNEAMVLLPDGSVVSGKVDSWRDYDQSDSIQIKINGVTYYTHLNNVVLISK